MDIQIAETIDGRSFNKFHEEIISCAICGEGTTMLGIEHCDRCHELDVRIRCDVAIAERLVNYYKAEGE